MGRLTRIIVLLSSLAALAHGGTVLVQQIVISGEPVSNGAFSCNTTAYLHVNGQPSRFSCYEVEGASLTLVYTDSPVKYSSGAVVIDIGASNGDSLSASVTPTGKSGKVQSIQTTATPHYIATPSTETTPSTGPTAAETASTTTTTVAVPTDSTVTTTTTKLTPQLIPINQLEDENLRRKRREAEEDQTSNGEATVTLTRFDDPGNAAAVWAAVIEGIILLALLCTCVYCFCIVPRRRPVADAFKPSDHNYSVSYDNNGYNARIDAFNYPNPGPTTTTTTNTTQASPTPARPPLPASNPISALPPRVDPFQPTHQRYDSSGLVTVNLA